MKKEMLLKEEDLQKEMFNAKNFRSYVAKNSSQFVFYYVVLLQFAVKSKIINEEQEKLIVSNLTKSINLLADMKINVVSNYLYVITLYLQNKSNWNAFKELEKLQDEKEVNLFLTNVTSWFLKKVQKLSEELKYFSKEIRFLDNKEIEKDFEFFLKRVKELQEFTSSNSVLNLKREHNSMLSIRYEIIKKIVTFNYFERLEVTIKYFIREVVILKKIDAKNLLKRQKEEIENASNIENNLGSFDKVLSDLKLEYENKLQKAIESSKKLGSQIESLEEEFRIEHPEIAEEDFDEMFEDYLCSLPEEGLESEEEDEEEVKRWYIKEKERINREFDKAEKELENKTYQVLSKLPLNAYTLSSIIKEYALFSLANKQEIQYPATLYERTELLLSISFKEAIPEFILGFADKLSEEDIKYLRGEEF